MNQLSVIVKPRIVIDRDSAYYAVKELTLSSVNSTLPTTINVPNTLFVYFIGVTVYAQDINGSTYRVTEQDSDVDQVKIAISIAGRPDLSEALQDVHLFNASWLSDGNQGIILPEKKDIKVEVGHTSNGASRLVAPIRFHIEFAGYEIINVEEDKPLGVR
ncbi:MAG: hypothetical protein HYX66_08940 [Ignavibacteria bacterium]|nr:hypothetical protein [Ignavibacteria bacterium]